MIKKILLSNTFIFVLVTTLCLVVLEVAIRYIVIGEPRIFQYSSNLGWDVKPDLNVIRKKQTRDWSVITDQRSNRVGSDLDAYRCDPADRITGIIGDSFAFGEGVNFEERFDRLAVETRNSLNFGVMGFSPLQSFLKLRAFEEENKCNFDRVILVSTENDIQDSAQLFSAYRARPILDRDGKVDFPDSFLLGLHGAVRDISYIYYGILRMLWSPPTADGSIENFLQNLRYIDRQVDSEFLIIFQGYSHELIGRISSSELCGEIVCLFYDVRSQDSPNLFLKGDIHWNSDGHKSFAEFMDYNLK